MKNAKIQILNVYHPELTGLSWSTKFDSEQNFFFTIFFLIFTFLDTHIFWDLVSYKEQIAIHEIRAGGTGLAPGSHALTIFANGKMRTEKVQVYKS